jgi:hypothetical protein
VHPPALETEPSEFVITGVLQPSKAVAKAGALTATGLQPRNWPAGHIPKVGGVTSCVHVNTCVQVAVLPHASVAVYVRVCARWQPVEVMMPSALVTTALPQPSLAIADGAGRSAGLQPRS